MKGLLRQLERRVHNLFFTSKADKHTFDEDHGAKTLSKNTMTASPNIVPIGERGATIEMKSGEWILYREDEDKCEIFMLNEKEVEDLVYVSSRAKK